MIYLIKMRHRSTKKGLILLYKHKGGVYDFLTEIIFDNTDFVCVVKG